MPYPKGKIRIRKRVKSQIHMDPLPGAVNNLKSVVEAGNLKIELPQTTGVSG